jgi:hypothetical protein
VEDLSRFPASQFARDPTTGKLSPDYLFLADYPGTSSGPRVSQFLLNSYVLDGVFIEQRIGTPLPATTLGIDFGWRMLRM